MQHLQQFPFFLILLFSSSRVCVALDCKLDYANPFKVAYTITVSHSGGENFKEVQKAIDSIPSDNTQWIRIQISRGKYQEKITIPTNKPCIFLQGAGSRLTIIEWGDHESTDSSATFTSYPDNIVAEGIMFKNSYNIPLSLDQSEIKQAVAARIYGDRSAFYRCGFVGLQDTLWDATGRHYFYRCYIAGAIDFIFGNGQSTYERCIIDLTVGKYAPEKQYGYITAQGRNSSNEPSGFVFKACLFTGYGKAYLGRAYGAYSRVVIVNSILSDIVEPEGWGAWYYVKHEENIEYAEVGCTGSGADTSKRVYWEKELNVTMLKKFVKISYIDQEGWINKLPKVF